MQNTAGLFFHLCFLLYSTWSCSRCQQHEPELLLLTAYMKEQQKRPVDGVCILSFSFPTVLWQACTEALMPHGICSTPSLLPCLSPAVLLWPAVMSVVTGWGWAGHHVTSPAACRCTGASEDKARGGGVTGGQCDDLGVVSFHPHPPTHVTPVLHIRSQITSDEESHTLHFSLYPFRMHNDNPKLLHDAGTLLMFEHSVLPIVLSCLPLFKIHFAVFMFVRVSRLVLFYFRTSLSTAA